MPATSTSFQQPPGPKKRLYATSLVSMRRSALDFLENVVANHGDVARFFIWSQPAWILNRPELIQEVLVGQASKFHKGRVLKRARIFLGDSLLTNEGEIHRRQRRLVQPAFHRARLAGYAETMVASARQVCESWVDGSELEVSSSMHRLTLAIVGRTLFRTDVEQEAQVIRDALGMLSENFGRMMWPLADVILKLPLPFSRRVKRARTTLDDLVYRLIRERRASGQDAGDLLSMLAFAEDGDHPGERLSDQEVRDQAMTLLIAGHETTANALAWTWALVAQSPAVEAQLHEEIERVLQGRLPGFGDVHALPFTEKIIKESMRLYPPAWSIGRSPPAAVRIGGYDIPAGALVLTSPWLMHRNPRFYPEPAVFNPSRWTEEFEAALPKFAYFPFGGGPRICVGEGFAWTELILVVATIAQQWRLRAIPGVVPLPLPRITLGLQPGFRLRAERRAAAG
jgi:cytochrome P450